MAALDRIINVQISTSAPAAPRPGFGTMLIFGPNGEFPEAVRTYTDMAGVADDFAVSDAEYIAATRAFSQALRPQKIKIGKGTTVAAAQVDTFTPNVATQAIQDYTVTIDGEEYTFTSDATPTALEVVAGLVALINAGTLPVTAGGTTTLTLTADVAGVPFTATSSANLTRAATTPNAGITSDLDAIEAADNDWYALVITSRTAANILAAAAWTEARDKIFFACSSEAGVLTSSTTDVASSLMARSYARTAYLYSADQAAYPEAAWLGGELPKQPGSSTYKFKTLAGIAVDSLTETQKTYARNKNANTYTSVGGSPITEEGKMAVGEFVDVIVGRDWIKSTMQFDAYDVLRSSHKVPMTDVGVAQMESVVRNVLQRAQGFQIIADDPPFEVTVPRAIDIPTSDRAARKLTGVGFEARLAGAVHFVDPLTGYLAV